MEKLADHIIFIGFMGSGKSSVARRLARFEKMMSIDMDVYIEREAGMSVSAIFEAEGEEGFRAREFDFLRSMLVRDRCILSCGGGVVAREESRDLLKRLGTIVYLEVDADEAISRISRPSTRPLLSGPIPPAEILASRLRYYEDAADLAVDTRGRSISQVVSAVQRVLCARGKLQRPFSQAKASSTARASGALSASRAPGAPGMSGTPGAPGAPNTSGALRAKKPAKRSARRGKR
jgi:shikimate kinase